MSDTKQIVISGNNIQTLKNYPDNYFDSILYKSRNNEQQEEEDNGYTQLNLFE